MIITIIILAYVANVFLNRWLNKIIYKELNHEKVLWLWFIPVLITIVFIWVILEESEKFKFKSNWFTGKYW
jgi:hypothetical protein